MIRELCFDRPDRQGVRRAHFARRPSIPLAAACLVANGMRETLRELLREPCELRIGEPVAIGAEVWAALSADAHCFLTGGRQTDIVFVVPAAGARRLVARAFGEPEVSAATELSALEAHALERIAARCAAAFDPLYAERRGPTQRVAPTTLPACAAFFEIYVCAPIALEIGIGVVRDLPDAGPAGSAKTPVLTRVPLEAHVEFAHGTIDARAVLDLALGDVVLLQSQVGAPALLKIADTYIASGAAGIVRGKYCLEIRTMHVTGAQS